MSEDARGLVVRHAARVGLDTVRFARVGPEAPDVARYDAWLAAGRHADMDYLVRGRDIRADLRRVFAPARTAAVFAVPHHFARPPDPGGLTGMVARYAWGRDYHNLVGKRLKRLLRGLRRDGVACWGSVDTGPILERAWARAAGMGFVGKNTVLFRPGETSWLFLAVAFLAVDIPPDPPLTRDHCGTCTRCLVACPTDAFVGPRQLDARRCISYWTIEARGLAPRALRPSFGRWVFGCDVCQEVCPHNSHPPDPEEEDLRPRHAWLDLPEIIATPDAALAERFTGTPLRRPGAAGLKRNALVVLANLADDRAVPAARQALEHPDPVVRAAAVWCLRRLGDPRIQSHDDPDPGVRAEVLAADA